MGTDCSCGAAVAVVGRWAETEIIEDMDADRVRDAAANGCGCKIGGTNACCCERLGASWLMDVASEVSSELAIRDSGEVGEEPEMDDAGGAREEDVTLLPDSVTTAFSVESLSLAVPVVRLRSDVDPEPSGTLSVGDRAGLAGRRGSGSGGNGVL